MGVILAVKKKGEICIAADTMTISGGSRKQTAEHVANASKIVTCADSYIGIADHPSWILVLNDYFKKKKQKPSLKSQKEIFQYLLDLHAALKEKYYLVPNASDDDPFESSRYESLIVNPHGIFKTYHLRSVQQFTHYTAIGSGAEYALGALFALYDLLDSAEEIAKAAMNSVVAFDDSTSLPISLYTMQAK